MTNILLCPESTLLGKLFIETHIDFGTSVISEYV